MMPIDRPLQLQTYAGFKISRKPIDPQQMNAEQKKLYQACIDFETVLTKQMLVAMQGSTSLFDNGLGGSYFESLFQDELAKDLSGQDSGLGDTLYRQLAKTYNSQIKTGK